MPFGQHQDTETKILGLQVSRHWKNLGESKFGFERTVVSSFTSLRHEGSGNELVDFSRAPCLGADQKARGLWNEIG